MNVLFMIFISFCSSLSTASDVVEEIR